MCMNPRIKQRHTCARALPARSPKKALEDEEENEDEDEAADDLLVRPQASP